MIETGDVRIERAFPNLRFAFPVSIKRAPGDSTHLYVAELGGRIMAFDASNEGVAAAQVVLDISERTNIAGEQGLLDFAFDPDYVNNGSLYVHYSANANPDVAVGDTVVARFQADPVARTADPTSTEVRLRVPQPPFPNHKGGSIEFGPDGKLYIALGDGGSGNDPGRRSQDLSVPLGKMLRINADGSIPEGNPFVGISVNGIPARGEIWALGLRNPFRFSFDGNRLWTGDVGQNAVEEIDLIVRGGNYGWRKFEGTRLNFPSDPDVENAISPLFEYTHVGNTSDERASITGGRVYRGTAIPALIGRYVYGDYASGRIWALSESGGVATDNILIGTEGAPTSFGTDLAGEMIYTGINGAVNRLVPADGGSAGLFPQRLSETGLFANLATLQPAPGVVRYVPNAPFWSDGTSKRRWIAVPGTAPKIAFSAEGNWEFPVGTVTVKHFEIALSSGAIKRLETRVFLNSEDNGWQGYTYRWNEAGTDAVLLLGAESESLDLTVADGSGGTRNQRYEFPSRTQCLDCHTSVAGRVLGLRTAQLNGGPDFNQLEALNEAGYLDRDIGAVSQYEALSDPFGPDDLSLRARAYLDTNCAQCHQPGGPTPVSDMDLRAATPMAETSTVGISASGGAVAEASLRIEAGNKANSQVWTRMNTLAEGERMPPLSSHVIDADGVALIGEWIDAGAN